MQTDRKVQIYTQIQTSSTCRSWDGWNKDKKVDRKDASTQGCNKIPELLDKLIVWGERERERERKSERGREILRQTKTERRRQI